MSLRFIKPTTITSAMLVSSTRAEDDYAAWSGVTTYASGDHCISATTHRVYQSVQASNLNHDPTTDTAGTWWVDIGPTNRWAMFDRAVGSVTSQAIELTVVLDPGTVNSLALLDVSASSIDVSMLDAPGGTTVYSQSYAMGDTANILDWYMYFFEPITPRTTLIVDDLPPYSTGRLTVTVNSSATAACGTLAVGSLIDVGGIQIGPRLGIVDYSRKETDTYGVTTVTQRAYAKRLECNIVIPNDRLDYIARALADVRATPVVWSGSDDYDSLSIYGWVRDWGISIQYYSYSVINLSIEGLT